MGEGSVAGAGAAGTYAETLASNDFFISSREGFLLSLAVVTGVLEATIAAMERSGADRARIVAALGPMIRQVNYEVGPEFIARFQEAEEANARFFRPSSRPDHALFDLAGYIAARLAAAGIRQVEDLGVCTYADATRFFSYRRSTHRRERDYGRHINAIALAN